MGLANVFTHEGPNVARVAWLMPLKRAMDSDALLLAKFLEGSEEAFEELVRRHEAAIRKLAFGFVRDRGLAEDIAQDAFLRAYRKAASFGGEGSVKNWLFRIAINRAQDELRRRKRKGEVSWEELDSPDEVGGTAASSIEDQAAASEFQQHLAQALTRLRKEYRTPLVLREVEGMTYQEIADFLHWPLGTVQTRVHRGRLELRSLLTKIRGKETWP